MVRSCVEIPVKIARILALALLALIIAGNVLVKSVDLASPFNGTVGYILHYPIIHTIGTKIVYWGLTRWPGHDNLAMTLSMTVCLLLSFALATCSFRYFESFFLRLKSHPAPSEPDQPGPAIS
jgi:peptidoglycan/LPS O-acetylase OafA/YrhL